MDGKVSHQRVQILQQMAVSERDTSRTLEIVSKSALVGMRQKYQNEHALLVSLLCGLLLVVVRAGQGLVNGSHGDNWSLWMCLQCRSRLQKKFNLLMPSMLA
jgi:hypothetical protein